MKQPTKKVYDIYEMRNGKKLDGEESMNVNGEKEDQQRVKY